MLKQCKKQLVPWIYRMFPDNRAVFIRVGWRVFGGGGDRMIQTSSFGDVKIVLHVLCGRIIKTHKKQKGMCPSMS